MINKNKGITLVALVITIIILLILAGISISALTNQGLFAKANESKQKTTEAETNQAKILNEYEEELNKYSSENVKEPFKGKTVTDAIQYADVLNNNDNTELQDAYGNKMVVPAGFKIVSNEDTSKVTTVDKGIVIEDATSAATAGSQFVWIPVGKIYTDVEKTESNAKTITLGRYGFYSNDIVNAYVEEDKGDITTTLKNWGNSIAKNITNFKNSVETNGGYYIGRYEARTTIARSNENDELAQITEKIKDPVYNFVTQSQATIKAQNMYNSNKFTSDLMNSYAWDTAITFIQKCTDQTNYENQNSKNTSLSQTGTTNDIQCNIFDMAGNVREWTTETSDNADSPCAYRGGSYDYDGDHTSTRGSNIVSSSFVNVGFRPLLYVAT